MIIWLLGRAYKYLLSTLRSDMYQNRAGEVLDLYLSKIWTCKIREREAVAIE